MENYVKTFQDFINENYHISEGRDWEDFKIDTVVKAFIRDYGDDKDVDTDSAIDWMGDFAGAKRIEWGMGDEFAADLLSALHAKGFKNIERVKK